MTLRKRLSPQLASLLIIFALLSGAHAPARRAAHARRASRALAGTFAAARAGLLAPRRQGRLARHGPRALRGGVEQVDAAGLEHEALHRRRRARPPRPRLPLRNFRLRPRAPRPRG